MRSAAVAPDRCRTFAHDQPTTAYTHDAVFSTTVVRNRYNFLCRTRQRRRAGKQAPALDAFGPHL